MGIICRLVGHKMIATTWVVEDLDSNDFVCTVRMVCPRCLHSISEEVGRVHRMDVSPRLWWNSMTERVTKALETAGR
jgi:hypothetical protein